MASSITFTVWPTRRQFRAYIDNDDFSDYETAYKNAHTEAAILAASYGYEAYVTFWNDHHRFGFEKPEDKEIVLSIMLSGLYRAYWDFKTKSWHPLPLCPEADEGYILTRMRLLPPPKKPV